MRHEAQVRANNRSSSARAVDASERCLIIKAARHSRRLRMTQGVPYHVATGSDPDVCEHAVQPVQPNHDAALPEPHFA